MKLYQTITLAVLFLAPLAFASAFTNFPFSSDSYETLQASATSSTFVGGDLVQTTERVNVRIAAGGTIVGTQEAGSRGFIVGTSVLSGDYGTDAFGSGTYGSIAYRWWNVDYQNGIDGWTAEPYLVRAVPVVPTVTMTAVPESITVGQSATIAWSAINATTCTGTGINTSGNTSGAVTVTPLETTTYSVTCAGTEGSATQSATVAVTAAPPPSAPTVTLTATPELIVQGDSATLSWTTTNVTTCNSYAIGSETSLITPTSLGALAPAPVANLTFGSAATVPPTGSAVVTPVQSTLYSLTCTGPGGSVTKTVTVAVSPASLAFSSGDSVRTTSNVNVRTSANGTIIGTQSVNALGAIMSGPSTAGGYSWWNVNFESGIDGWTAEPFLEKVGVTQPAPTVTFTANPEIIDSGKNSELMWDAKNATTCTGTNFSTEGFVLSEAIVAPTQTTTYSITCTGPGGSVTKSVTVTVRTPSARRPTVSVSASPKTVDYGKEVKVSWKSRYADYCRSGEAPVGTVGVDSTDVTRLAASGSFTDKPAQNKTYEVTCIGAGGQNTGSASVKVRPATETVTEEQRQEETASLPTSPAEDEPEEPTPLPTISSDYTINIAGTKQNLLQALTLPAPTIAAPAGSWVPILQGTPGNDVFDARNYGGRAEFHSNGGDDAVYMSSITAEKIVLPSSGDRGVLTIISRHGWGTFALPSEVDNMVYAGNGQNLNMRGNNRDNILVTVTQPMRFDPGAGDNIIVAGSGRDEVTITAGGTDTIINFDTRSPGGDLIRLPAKSFASYRELKAAMRQNGPHVVLTLPAGGSVIFVNKNLTSFVPAHFAALSSDWRDTGLVLGVSTDGLLTERLSLGSSGVEVSRLQTILSTLGYYFDENTGYFGPQTETSVKAFQVDHGLEPLGIVGPQTRQILNESGAWEVSQW